MTCSTLPCPPSTISPSLIQQPPCKPACGVLLFPPGHHVCLSCLAMQVGPLHPALRLICIGSSAGSSLQRLHGAVWAQACPISSGAQRRDEWSIPRCDTRRIHLGWCCGGHAWLWQAPEPRRPPVQRARGAPAPSPAQLEGAQHTVDESCMAMHAFKQRRCHASAAWPC